MIGEAVAPLYAIWYAVAKDIIQARSQADTLKARIANYTTM